MTFRASVAAFVLLLSTATTLTWGDSVDAACVIYPAGSDYDATALFRCKAPGDSEFGSCPGGIVRMGGNQASIVVQNQAGEQFTINFMADCINAINREVKLRLEDDLRTLEFENGEVWEEPLAAIEGD
jgi:hypothetical protein